MECHYKTKVNISMFNIKGVSANWILSAVDYISNNPYICVNGFRLAVSVLMIATSHNH